MLFEVECGGGLYWGLPLTTLGCMGLITYLSGRYLQRLHAVDSAHKAYEALEGDVTWDSSAVVKFPLVSSLAGVAAGLLGIGGGILKGPLMLEMGMLPGVSAATAAFMVLFTSSATTLQFVLLGMLRLDYSLWYGAVGMCGTIVGQKLAGYFIKKYKRQSLIIFLLGGVIALSAAVMGAVGAAEVWADYQAADWEAFQFSPLCE